jgi:hypothetical protein
VTLPPLDDELAMVPARRHRLPVLVAVVAAVAVLLAVAVAALVVVTRDDQPANDVATIDGGSTDAESSGGSGSDVDRTKLEDASLAYGECMRDHGVDLPDPQTSSGGDSGPKFSSSGAAGGATRGPDGESEEFQAAHEACKSILEDAGALIGPPSAEQQAEMQDKLVEVARCMRERGYDFPDPQISADGGVTMSGGPQGSGSEQYQQDFEECNEQVGMTGPRVANGGDAGGDQS